MRPYLTFDIFCTVIDNFGDIGVCWRLSRQLVQEHGCRVRLWVDDLSAFRWLCPEIDAQQAHQVVAGVEVLQWADTSAHVSQWKPGDIVVEAFGCDLPSWVLAAMAERSAPPVWLNLEYLSAETWVKGHHALTSPHPSLPLVRHFFFPGFEAGTGGLLCESALEEQRQTFLSSTASRQRLWHQLGIEHPEETACLASLFTYPNPGLPTLLSQWQSSSQPVICLVPDGLAAQQIRDLLGTPSYAGPPGQLPDRQRPSWRKGQLTVIPIPFVRQEQFDELLWACDVNFVRGEDSFVRAQWACKPFIWHIYPQDEAAHLLKLDAFLAHYSTRLPAAEAQVERVFWHAWNNPAASTSLDWNAFRATLPAQMRAATPWAKQLRSLGDLAANLVQFCEIRLK
jgi:uncharacterized repeat protein (TIGR03837 family)